MKENEEFNLYNEKSREELSDADELDPEEAGFMKGYDEDSNPAECANCEKVLEEHFVEKQISEETYRFCSDECADKFERQKEHV